MRSRATRSKPVLLAVLTGLLLAAPAGPVSAGEDAAILLAPDDLPAGGQSSVTVTTLDAETREPIARPVAVVLLRGDDAVATLFEGATGADGHVRAPFEVPDTDPGPYTISARMGDGGTTLRVETTVSAAPAILVETDKPIYKPGQTLQGRVVLLDNALRPKAGEVELSIRDAKGIRVARRSLEADTWGVADFELELAKELNTGTWKVAARSESVETVRDVRVQDYVLPKFEARIDLPRPWALVDEDVNGRIEASYFYGRPVSGQAALIARRWTGTWEEYHRIEQDLSGGALDFTLPPVEFVAGAPEQGGQGAVTLELEVEDTAGNRETTRRTLTIVQSRLVLGLVPRTRFLKPELPFEVLVTGESPDGEPLDASAELVATWNRPWGEAIGESRIPVEITGGSGTVELTPPEETAWADLVVEAKHEGRRSRASVRLDGSFSSGGGYIGLTRQGSGALAAGERATFTVAATHPGTVYHEVYAGGRTVASGASEDGTFEVAVSPDMVPAARVVAYQIQPGGEVAADSTEIRVELDATIEVQTSFDREEVRPGDPVELRIDAGTGQRTLLGVSLVDESVLALGRGRLRLADVFAELERRFLEPRVEVHEEGPGGPVGGPELADGIAAGGVRAPRSRGALDVLQEAGYAVASTPNLYLASGDRFWRDDVLEDGPPVAGPEAGQDGGTSAPEDVRVRQFFPETWVWEPRLLTDEEGVATLELTAPDSITGWKLQIMGTSSEGVGMGEGELSVFQEFFVEPALPVAVTRGEEITLKVDVFNWIDEPQTVDIGFADGSWYEALGETSREVEVPARSATPVEFPIRPTELGEHPVELVARGSLLSDAVRRDLRVEPEGVPAESVTNGVIEAGTVLEVDRSLPSGVVPGSARCLLNITPSPVAQTLSGIDDLLEMPYGCGEQNMIYLAPDIEVLKYLREIGELATEVRAEAERFINLGYQRQLTFQTEDGGFAAFGGDEGSLWLTAFVLSTFSGAREVRDVDESVLARAAAMLVGRQEPDGSFRTDDFLIHKEMDGGLENLYAMAAYVTNALADYAAGGDVTPEVEQAIGRAAAYLRDARGPVDDDAYSLSIAAVALGKVAGFEGEAEAVVDRLLELASTDGTGLHWEPYPVETTGYATMALLALDRSQASAAVDWLSTQRNSLGGYGQSTQDTVVALRALFEAARKVRRDVDLTLSLVEGDKTLWSTQVDASNFDVLQSTPIPPPAAGASPLELRAEGRGSVSWQVAKRYHVPGELLPPSRDLGIDVEYLAGHVEVDDIVDVRVRLLYDGPKEATGMVIADIGVPTGFAAVGASLETLVEDGLVERTERAERKVILYIDSLRAGEAVELVFSIRALWPVRAEGPVSTAYEYYDADVRGWDRTASVTVAEEPDTTTRFVRGDANADSALDLSDAVATLEWLFKGSAAADLACADAADANDDGRLNITDPIYFLGHLFLGGPPPPSPWPEPGEDPTEDPLVCHQGT